VTVRGRTQASSRSPFMLRFFGRVFARELTSHFHAVRLLGSVPRLSGPTVIYANHPSWWDAAIFVWLSATIFADRPCAAPIDAAMLRKYPFFARIGAFGVEPGTFAGASAFLESASDVLAANGVLLVNAEGRFADVRPRRLAIQSGLAHLAARVPHARFIPLAFEYTFWDEKRPNALLHFGAPIAAADLAAEDRGAATQRLQQALAGTMDRLAEAGTARDASRFDILLTGRVRIHRIYDAWRTLSSKLAGKRFDAAHRADT
jgi:1-acyl-sn-glycerol-3-phosphate acyltransferase